MIDPGLWLERPFSELRAILDVGRPIDANDLVGWTYDGVALLPGWARRLTWTRFQKRFGVHKGAVVGWNVRVHQDTAGAYRPKTRDGADASWGPFVVRRAEADEDGAIIFDYRPPAPRMSPNRRLFDPVVAVGDDPSVLLGVTDIRLAGRSVRTPTWFVLQRAGRAGDVPNFLRALKIPR